MIGLNLRMTEQTAAIACAQLARAPVIMPGRIALAEEITDMFYGVPWVIPPIRDIDCTHSYYIWAARIQAGKRNDLLDNLANSNLPMRRGYSPTLNSIFDGKQSCPVAEKMEYDELITFEICAYDPKARHLKQMREIVKHATGELDERPPWE